ncbi:MAG: sporulation protein YqfD, partial [Clostridia bacterium]|nr:sporulation protein YqfD [Clostridia bacterium]
MLWFYRFISGFLELEISGDTTEQFLNLCARSGYIVWHVRRMKERLYCHILVRDFKRLRKRMRKSGARVHITAKVGLPFWTARYHRRWGIPVGAVLFFVILKLLSGFIWSIEVEGNLTVPTEEILDACRKTGVFEGAYAGGIDYKIAGQQLLLEMPDLAWAAINLEGCQVTVNVSETKTPIREETRPCNIKAKADGIITKIDVQRGDCVVKVGDAVSRGDLLISGLVEKGGVITPVRAAGTITATTTREVTFSAPYRRANRIRTGKKKTRRVLQAFGVSAPLYLG